MHQVCRPLGRHRRHRGDAGSTGLPMDVKITWSSPSQPSVVRYKLWYTAKESVSFSVKRGTGEQTERPSFQTPIECPPTDSTMLGKNGECCKIKQRREEPRYKQQQLGLVQHGSGHGDRFAVPPVFRQFRVASSQHIKLLLAAERQTITHFEGLTSVPTNTLVLMGSSLPDFFDANDVPGAGATAMRQPS